MTIYQLSISDFKGITPEDPFGVGSKSYYNLDLMKFTTRDNDLWIGGNCGVNGHSSTCQLQVDGGTTIVSL